MRYRLAVAPVWALRVVSGVTFGVLFGLFGWLRTHEPIPQFIVGLVGGAFFGLVMGPAIARQNELAFAASGEHLTRDERLEVARALPRNGPVPPDPRLRAAAVSMLVHQQSVAEEQRTFAMVVFGGFIALTIVMAFAWTPWWGLAAVPFAGMAVLTPLAPRRIERRLDALDEAGLAQAGLRDPDLDEPGT